MVEAHLQEAFALVNQVMGSSGCLPNITYGMERFRQELAAAVKSFGGRMVAKLLTPGSWWLVDDGSRWMTRL